MCSPPSYPSYDGLEQKSMLQVSSFCVVVDCSVFWGKVIIMGGLSKNISDVLSIEPNLLHLMILNTEHKSSPEEWRIEND